MIVLTVVLLFIILILFDFVSVVKQKNKSEIWVYSVILVISFIVLTIRSIDYNLPKIYPSIKMLFENIFK